MNKTKLKKTLRSFADNGVNLILLSILTGLFAGVVVTFYNILASLGEGTAEKLYKLILDNPAFIPVLLLGLFAGGIIIGVMVKFVPMIRGSGIPQIEGAARGLFRFKWYVTMCSMFAASLACVFLGLSAGSEGPSLEIGGCAGEAVGATLKRSKMIRRLQIASGSSAGLAVAFNAPITGLVFAMEEAFRSFSPQVFICAAISVVTALFTRNLIRPPLGFNTGFTFENFHFAPFSFELCGWVVPAAVITSLLGVAFYYAVIGAKKLFKNITFFKGAGKFSIVFIIAGVFALITLYAIGGGHSFIDALSTGGSGEINIEKVFGLSVAASLVIILLIRFFAAVMNMSCGVPCGVFIPMLAIGAGAGGLLSLLFQKAGMDGVMSDYIVIICMSVFFTTVVKAPITGIVMVFELTGQFTNFLPAMLGIALGYLISMIFKLEPIYERSLNEYIEAEKINENVKKERISVLITPQSKADGAKIRAIIWPTNGLVVEIIEEDGKVIVPDGETVMQAGSMLVFECETDSREELLQYLISIVGKQPEEIADGTS